MASPTTFLTTYILALLLSIQSAHGQHIQAWTWQTVNRVDTPHWRPHAGAQLQPIIVLEKYSVSLTYNCHYMPAICQNVDQYMASTQSRARRYPHSFAYDLNADRGGDSSMGRRFYMCPKNWAKSKPDRCPHSNQPYPMRRDGNRWPTTDVIPLNLNPPNIADKHTKLFVIKSVADGMGNKRESGLYYSCDEFPPAKWVEGGVGLLNPPNPPPNEGSGQPGFTRCAPAKYCTSSAAIDGEQDWQSYVHSTLRGRLEKFAREQLKLNNQQVRLSDQVVQFFFHAEDLGPTSVAATVFIEDFDRDQTDEIETYARRKRRSANETLSPTWILDKLERGEKTRGVPGRAARVFSVFVNGSSSDSSDDLGFPSADSLGLGLGLGLSMPGVFADVDPLPSLGVNRSAADTVRILDEGRKTGSFPFVVGDPAAGKKGHPLVRRQPQPQDEGAGAGAGAPEPGTTSVHQAASSSASSSANASASTALNTPPAGSGATELEGMDMAEARALVQQAIAQASVLNRRRIENPSRNRYGLKPGTVVNGQPPVGRRSAGNAGGRWRRQTGGNKTPRPQDDQEPSPLYKVTPQVAAAAALVAEFDARQARGMANNATVPTNLNSTTAPSSSSSSTAAPPSSSAAAPDNSTSGAPPLLSRRAGPGTFWMEHISRKGTVPWGSDPNYKVFRNVKDYGAVGDGLTDDTASIRAAMFDGNRCGENCNGATINNAVVYFPPGEYLVSGTIQVIYGTQLIGDANNWPTIKAASSFVGLGVLSTNEYVEDGGIGTDGLAMEWYVNTASFYRQIRNFKIDIRATDPNAYVCGIHYQVAQATSLQFVEIIANRATTQQGMYSENGSGGVMADVTFRGCNFGFYGGNQQFTSQRIKFIDCNTAVQLQWDWGWVWKSVHIEDCTTGFRLAPPAGTPNTGNIGSISFLDSKFVRVDTAIVVAPPSSTPGSGSTGLILENVHMSDVDVAVAGSDNSVLLVGGDWHVAAWALGPVYSAGEERTFSFGEEVDPYPREETLLDLSNGPNRAPYFERPKPQYENLPAGAFVHLKDEGAKGDGSTDDTTAFQRALNRNVGNVIFVDAGTYILTSTVTIPPGTKLVGETWSQFAARGSFFMDPENPKVMIRVGKPGDVGDVEMQDLLFTTKGPTAGAILVQWNIKAATKGSAGLWDCHVRIGGALGTDLNPTECPAITTGTNPNCQAASLMMHIAPGSSGYFENAWLWTGDHEIDDPLLQDNNNTMVQVSVYVARGLLVESTDATWLYGTSSEHAVYYQYNFHKARNVFAGMVQTESPYYQPMPMAPEPFRSSVGALPGDPDYSCNGDDFDGCDSSWAVMITGCHNVFVAGAGLYSWFDTYAQDCIGLHACQKALVYMKDNYDNVRLQHLITIGAKYMLVSDGEGVLAVDNLNVQSHPKWSQMTIFDVLRKRSMHMSPELATIVPLPHTTVPAGQTLTISAILRADITGLPKSGAQNNGPGPGGDICPQCCFFRRLTSTCCGTGGSIGNPIEIAAGIQTPMDISLPAGFTPNQRFLDGRGNAHAAGVALAEDTILPIGFLFAKPFVIPAGQALCAGEDIDESLTWIDPVIWDSPNPQVTCSPPCTLVLPPWDRTGTIDYPLVTINTPGLTTTLTTKPITVTEWIVSPVTISTATPTDGTTTIVITPTLASTTTWPPIKYTETDGTVKTTRPPGVHPPPPIIRPGPPPRITIVLPGPPGPKVKPCSFPIIGSVFCPPGTRGASGGKAPPEDDERDPEEDEELQSCLLTFAGEPFDEGSLMDIYGDSVQPAPPPQGPAPPVITPNPSQNERSCYNFGHWFHSTADKYFHQFCQMVYDMSRVPGVTGSFVQHPLDKNFFLEKSFHMGVTHQDSLPGVSGSVDQGTLVLSLEVKKNCRWESTVAECVRYLEVLEHSCDCSGTERKQGGVLTNNCLVVRVDPNVR